MGHAPMPDKSPSALWKWLTGSPQAGEGGSAQRAKPANLVYAVDESPPLLTILVLGVQHVFVMSVGWVFVVVLVTAVAGTPAQSQSIIRMSMIASGVATILQARANVLVGSGYLCPLSCGPSYLAASMLAGKTGGLSLMFGLTTVSGVFEALLSRVIQRLRALFPPEVTGLVVAMVGIELIALGCPRFLGYAGPGSVLDARSTLVAFITLAAMVAPTVWSKGKLRLYPVLLGLSAGYVSAFATGILTWSQLGAFLAVPMVSLPHRLPVGITLSFAFLAPFLIASLSSVLKTVGDLTLCQKINDTKWKRTDMKSVGGGILAGSVGTTLAGLIGGLGQSTFSSNVGLSMATGATSRVIALPAGVFLIALAFFPKLAAVFTAMPQPVMGAVLVYVACFMIVGGVQVMTSRMLDARRIFAVGIALVFGLSVRMVPGMYEHMPGALLPLFSSALSVTTVLVVLLSLLFRIGVAKRRTIELVPGPDILDIVSRFMEEQGGAWGMRTEVVSRATDALYEFMANAPGLQLRSPAVLVQLAFDEFNLEMDIDYEGLPLHLPTALPSVEQLAEERTVALLSGYLIRQRADRVKVTSRDDHCRVHLHFDH